MGLCGYAMQVQGYIDIHVNCPIARVLSYLFLTVRACSIKFV